MPCHNNDFFTERRKKTVLFLFKSQNEHPSPTSKHRAGLPRLWAPVSAFWVLDLCSWPPQSMVYQQRSPSHASCLVIPGVWLEKKSSDNLLQLSQVKKGQNAECVLRHCTFFVYTIYCLAVITNYLQLFKAYSTITVWTQWRHLNKSMNRKMEWRLWGRLCKGTSRGGARQRGVSLISLFFKLLPTVTPSSEEWGKVNYYCNPGVMSCGAIVDKENNNIMHYTERRREISGVRVHCVDTGLNTNVLKCQIVLCRLLIFWLFFVTEWKNFLATWEQL